MKNDPAKGKNATGRRALEELRISMDHLRTAGELFASSLQEGANAVLTRSRLRVLLDGWARNRRTQGGLRRRVGRLLQLPVAGAGALERSIQRLPVAGRHEVADLARRIARLEERLERLGKERVA